MERHFLIYYTFMSGNVRGDGNTRGTLPAGVRLTHSVVQAWEKSIRSVPGMPAGANVVVSNIIPLESE